MKIELLEKVKDHYINLYEVGIFIRAIEYSAYEVSLVLDYKYYLNINKKTGFVFLEAGFPKNMLDKNIQILVGKGYSVRYINKQNEITLFDTEQKDFKKDISLKEIKQDLILL